MVGKAIPAQAVAVAEAPGLPAAERAGHAAAKLGAMKVGRGTEDDVKVGPLIDSGQRGKVAELVDDATGKGAQILVGGTARDGAGYFYEPTVLGGVSADEDRRAQGVPALDSHHHRRPEQQRPAPQTERPALGQLVQAPVMGDNPGVAQALQPHGTA